MTAAENKAVFLSYASQDAKAARRIGDSLRAAGIEVWFDQNELRGGDAWDAKIRRRIKECALFVPIISANTQARREGYFRLEWRLADQRTHMMGRTTVLIVPVCIDETPNQEADVPDSFLEVQWSRLPAGRVSEDFAEHVKQLLACENSHITPAPFALPAREVPETGSSAAPHRAGPGRGRIIVGASLVVVGIMAMWQPWERPPATPANNAGRPVTAAADGAATPAATSDKSVVVLPLENLSPDPENAFFTDGMHAEIIATLQQLADLKVISRGSALEFKSTTPLREVAAKLGVAHAITGTVRRADKQVRIHLDLRRTSDEALVWNQTFNRELSDVLSIQTEIAKEVARVLRAREAKGWLGGAHVMTSNPAALDLYLKVRQQLLERSPTADHGDLLAPLEEAFRLDPNFMHAASLLSTAHNLEYRIKRDPRQRAHHANEAKRWAETASRLVPGGAGDSSLAAYYFQIGGDPARALALMDNVVRALPNDSSGINRRGVALGRLGRVAESATAYAEALKLDPLNALIRSNHLSALARLRRKTEFDAALAEMHSLLPAATSARHTAFLSSYMMTGRLPESFEGVTAAEKSFWLERKRSFTEQLALTQTRLGAPGLTPADEFWLRTSEAETLKRLGRAADATASARRALTLAEQLQAETEIDPAEKDRRTAIALVLNGRVDEGLAAQRRVVGAFSPGTHAADRWAAEIDLARLCATAGRTRECVEALAPLLRVPCGLTVPMLRLEPVWDGVRDDAEFKALLADAKNSAPL